MRRKSEVNLTSLHHQLDAARAGSTSAADAAVTRDTRSHVRHDEDEEYAIRKRWKVLCFRCRYSPCAPRRRKYVFHSQLASFFLTIMSAALSGSDCKKAAFTGPLEPKS